MPAVTISRTYRFLTCLLSAFAFGCQPSSPPLASQPDGQGVREEAVLQSLDKFCREDMGFDETIYIRPGEFVPDPLEQIGERKAEVVTEQELAKRSAGQKRAPSMVTVTVQNSSDASADFCVSVSYTGIPVVGAQAIPIGGGRFYYYKERDGKPVLTRSGGVTF